jgi:hypothetical protein
VSEHTKEPWEYTVWNDGTVSVTNDDQDTIAKLEDLFKCGDAITNARRIVACVNALEGIPTKDLEVLKGSMAERIIQAEAQVKALVEQRKAILDESEARLSLADELAAGLASFHGNGNCVTRMRGGSCPTCDLLDKHLEMRGK